MNADGSCQMTLPSPPESYTWLQTSSDGNVALAASYWTKIWRHSYHAVHHVKIGTGDLLPLDTNRSPQRYAVLSPDGTFVAYVHGCNIWMKDLNKPDSTNLLQVTNDDVAGRSCVGPTEASSSLFNGVCDWVYEEEVFSSPGALWFSPPSPHSLPPPPYPSPPGPFLAYLRTDDSNVSITVVEYAPPVSENSFYPRQVPIRYPKPGTPNPTASVWVYNAGGVSKNHCRNRRFEDQCSRTELPLPPLCSSPSNCIISQVAWVDHDVLMVSVLNRNQTLQSVAFYSFTYDLRETHVVFVPHMRALWDRSDDSWIESEVTCCANSSSSSSSMRADIVCVGISNVSAHRGLVGVVIPSSIDLRPTPSSPVLNLASYHITPQDTGKGRIADVFDFVGWITRGEWLVVSASVENESLAERSIWAIHTGTMQSERISDRGGFYSASLPPPSSPPSSASLLLLTRLGPEVPFQSLAVISPSASTISIAFPLPSPDSSPSCSSSQPKPSLLPDNRELQCLLDSDAVPTVSYDTIQVNDLLFDMRLVVPIGFNTSSPSRRLPVLFKVYGGPGSILVTKSFRLGFDEWVASKGFAVVTVDARGTGGRGHSWSRLTYLNLGATEALDQIAAAEKLKTFAWVDGSRMALWGWSYGGYVTARAASDDSNKVFSAFVSVAPVTDWRDYDSIYTERYMGELSSSTLASYLNASLLTPLRAAAVQTPIFLAHGLSDDNVHPLNTEQLVEALLSAGNSDFSMQFYPNRDHGIAGRSTRRHLYKSIFAFLVRCLSPPVVFEDSLPAAKQQLPPQLTNALRDRRVEEEMQY
jgi:dipeptidyl aminopeptidase